MAANAGLHYYLKYLLCLPATAEHGSPWTSTFFCFTLKSRRHQDHLIPGWLVAHHLKLISARLIDSHNSKTLLSCSDQPSPKQARVLLDRLLLEATFQMLTISTRFPLDNILAISSRIGITACRGLSRIHFAVLVILTSARKARVTHCLRLPWTVSFCYDCLIHQG